jgi:hypothetical protein
MDVLISVPGRGDMRSRRRVRFVIPGGVRAWCASGRWGPRRVRVSECIAVVTAEAVYTALMGHDRQRLQPGAGGYVSWMVAGRTLSVRWELRANTIWRFGRVFLQCAICTGRATRIYVPTEDASPACRRCWGLTYESRQRRNYKDVGRFAALGFTARTLAYSQTLAERERRAAAAAARRVERCKRNRT